MNEPLPRDFINAVALLDRCFESGSHIERCRQCKDGIYVLNDCLEEFPALEADIREAKFSFTAKLLTSIQSTLPSPDYTTWLEYTLLFCIDLKHEIKHIYLSDPQLFEFFLKFISIHSDTITPELKLNISNFLTEVTD